MLRLIPVFFRINRRLTLGIIAIGSAQGLLLPGFALATGWLVGSLEAGRSPVGPVAVVAVVFSLQRLLDPIATELGQMLRRQVDESLTERVMRALASPPGLAHVEDPAVLDAAVQAEGALTGTTPGEAAAHVDTAVRSRVSAGAALMIVASYRPVLVPVLTVAYLLAFRFSAWHWRQVAQVVMVGTDQLRRSFYLRTLALTHTVAKETRVFGLSGWLVDRYRDSWLDVMRTVWARRQQGWGRICAIVGLLAGVEILALGGLARDATSGEVAVGATVALAQAMLAASMLAEFSDFHWSAAESLIAVERLRELEAAATAATREMAGTRTAEGLPQASIRLEGVGFTYPGRDVPVFEGFDLEIPVGRSLAIVGENGAGKTTLVKLLARLHDPDHGRVLVDGTDLRELGPVSWRARLAPVFQDHLQLEISAYDNVVFGSLDNATDADGVEHAARLGGAAGLVSRLSSGWNTTLSRAFSGGTQLSGGEWQRLALSRAMFAVHSGASVLILDEPTAAMDVRGEAEVYERFLEITRGVTTIVISHRFSTVRRADRIVVIEGGRVVEDGTHEELLAAGGRYATMYQLQAVRFASGEPADA